MMTNGKDNVDPAKPDPKAGDDIADRSKVDTGPLGDARPEKDGPDTRTGGSQPQEDIDDRDNVGSVTPEDYPEGQRAAGQ